MTTTIPTSAAASSANSYLALNADTTAAKASTTDEMASRFLKLLVTQLQNQDPLNPMDNAQITSQMAQINTVNGIERLNTTVAGLNGQFTQLQALTGASLVGRDVTVPGNRLALVGGKATAGFELSNPASSVKVEVLSAIGQVVDTMNLGPQAIGRNSFNWAPANQVDRPDYSFRITATSGATVLGATPLMRDRVTAVSTSGNNLLLQTVHNGSVAYSDIKGFN